MELKNLYTIRRIVETGSYQKAAIACNYAQSTVTFQVRQVEEELGVRLFEKRDNHMVLTPQGEAVLPLIEQTLAAADSLAVYAGRSGTLRPALRITMPETLFSYKMQEVLRAFKKDAPDVNMILQVMNCYAIYDALVQGETDIAIHYDVRNYPHNVVTKRLQTYPLVMVASPELDDETADFVTPNRKKHIYHIRNDADAVYIKMLDAYLKRKRITMDGCLDIRSIDAIKRGVMSNLGVAFLPRFAVEAELNAGLLRECPMDMEHKEITAICAYGKERLHDPVTVRFLRELEQGLH